MTGRSTVLLAIGADRPGLVEEVAEFVAGHGGSVEESRMLNLHGQFAIAMVVTGSDGALEALAAGLDGLAAAAGIDARLTPVGAEARPAPRPLYRIEAKALDQPGLVHQVADALRRANANIESMETTIEPAPVTGTPVFAMEIVVSGGDETLHGELERVCRELDVDWSLSVVD